MCVYVYNICTYFYKNIYDRKNRWKNKQKIYLYYYPLKLFSSDCLNTHETVKRKRKGKRKAGCLFVAIDTPTYHFTQDCNLESRKISQPYFRLTTECMILRKMWFTKKAVPVKSTYSGRQITSSV